MPAVDTSNLDSRTVKDHLGRVYTLVSKTIDPRLVTGTLPAGVENPSTAVSTPVNGALQYNRNVADAAQRESAYLLGRDDIGHRVLAVVKVNGALIATPPSRTVVEAAPPKVRCLASPPSCVGVGVRVDVWVWVWVLLWVWVRGCMCVCVLLWV